MWLRKNEARIHSTVGLSGGNYSIRKELWKKMPSDFVHDDLYSVFSLLESGKRLLFEPGAISSEDFTRSAKQEFSRKARFASRGYATLHYFPELLTLQAGFVSAMIWSHKILRWISPFLFLLIFCSTILGIGGEHNSFFTILFVGEVSFLSIALVGWILDSFGISIPIIRHIFWFTAMNLAFMVGTIRFLLKRDERHWTTTEMTPMKKKGTVLV
jgi:cellulose synthase/poly-beta-1,6-N-acetylglucosamine synthase-like glycosyltransferase